MAIIGANSNKPNKVNRLTSKERDDIDTHLQKKIDDWCVNHGKKEFPARYLVGGKNSDWRGTVLYPLYTKQQTTGKTKKKVAGQELGRILKCVILKDNRNFKCKKNLMQTTTLCYKCTNPSTKKRGQPRFFMISP